MATPEQLREMSKKAVLSPNIGKHGKWKKTLEKEERRAIFEKLITQTWEEIIPKLPPVYIADQFMGKAVEKSEVDITTKGEKLNISLEKIEEINKVALDESE